MAVRIIDGEPYYSTDAIVQLLSYLREFGGWRRHTKEQWRAQIPGLVIAMLRRWRESPEAIREYLENGTPETVARRKEHLAALGEVVTERSEGP